MKDINLHLLLMLNVSTSGTHMHFNYIGEFTADITGHLQANLGFPWTYGGSRDNSCTAPSPLFFQMQDIWRPDRTSVFPTLYSIILTLSICLTAASTALLCDQQKILTNCIGREVKLIQESKNNICTKAYEKMQVEPFKAASSPAEKKPYFVMNCTV